jgi:prepilin-type N-terminal cleavage/methylation domain-containing protein
MSSEPMTVASASSRRNAQAFTLVELMVVVLLMSIVAVSVIPVIGNVQLMRNGAARDDAMRLLELAKARALATGLPNGVSVDLADSSLTLLQITDAGQVETVVDPLTYQSRSIVLPAAYSGVSVESMVNGDGARGSGVIWFDFEANPHTRESNGEFTELNDEPAQIVLSSQEAVVVHAYSGLVESR